MLPVPSKVHANVYGWTTCCLTKSKYISSSILCYVKYVDIAVIRGDNRILLYVEVVPKRLTILDCKVNDCSQLKRGSHISVINLYNSTG